LNNYQTRYYRLNAYKKQVSLKTIFIPQSKMKKLLVFTFLVFCLGNHLLAADMQNDVLNFTHYTNEEGLPSSYVKSITQDHHGFIWLVTREKNYRFDGHEFLDFPSYNENGQPFQLNSFRIFMHNDSLLLTQAIEGSYYYFDFNNEFFKPFNPLNEFDTIVQAESSSFDDFLFLKRGKLFSKNLSDKKLKVFPDNLESEETVLFVLLKELDEKIVAVSNNWDVVVFNRDTKIEKVFKIPTIKKSGISTLYLDTKNNAWLGTYSEGVFKLNLENGSAVNYAKSISGKGLIHNMVHTICEDHQGRVWIGTEGGLSVWNPTTKTITNHKNDFSNPSSLNSNSIYSSFCDNSGNIWLGTYSGGVNFWSNHQNFFTTWKPGIDNKHLDGNVVSCFEEDKNGNIWIGFKDEGLNMFNIEDRVFEKYTCNSDSSIFNYNNINDLFFEDESRLWVATYTGGISVLNIKTGKVEYINSVTHPTLTTDNIFSFLRYNDTIFIGTTSGIYLYDLSNKAIYPFFSDVSGGIQIESICESKTGLWFSSFIGAFFYSFEKQTLVKFDRIPEMKGIGFVKVDSNERVWFGDSYNGLCYYDERQDTVVYFNKENGFPASRIFALEEVKNEWFWASTNKGLVNFNAVTHESQLYGNISGVPFSQFNYRASFKDSNGNVYFGDNKGMVSFNENVNIENNSLNLNFTKLLLFNETVYPGEDAPIKKSLYQGSDIVLNHKQNVISIYFSGFNFSNQGRCQYAYYLENFEENWNYVGNRPFATYTSLRPGKYIFHVKASAGYFDWNNEVISLTIKVKPPFYLSIWAYLVYIILFSGIFISVYLFMLKIQKNKDLVDFERREKAHTAALNRNKLEFFTNISHEIRTPLSLIIGPMSTIIQEEQISPSVKQKLSGINNNAGRLLGLINQLLEFRKIETGMQKLKICSSAGLNFLEELEGSFINISEKKNIEFVVKTNVPDQELWFDIDIVIKILFNLLSNAFKYTPKDGKIVLTANIFSAENDCKMLEFKIIDSGVGIAKENQLKIFDRFYQVNSNQTKESGSGIGLAYVKSLVTHHKGEIRVESELNRGSVFTVTVPVSVNSYENDEVCTGQEQFNKSIDLPAESEFNELLVNDKIGLVSDKPSLLVIDDNKELLEFISEGLKEQYNVYVAENGEEGLRRIPEVMPDIIISDVMMPVMDGIEFTKIVKDNIETSHIPIILLTAKTDYDTKFDGLKTGADYFIEKPFYIQILQQNILNIQSTRKSLIHLYKKNADILPTEITHSQKDREFIRHFTEIVQANIDKQDLDVSFMIKEMAVSRTLLHIKIKNLAGLSTTEFINTIRFREAIKLISEGKCNISEAAYQTGFSSPAYFSSSFKKSFGKSPSDYFN
jgi:signal transduction histidine kinase/ligand-binding sensor domain-containing protein/DNA-binding response OmpR family regulator